MPAESSERLSRLLYLRDGRLTARHRGGQSAKIRNVRVGTFLELRGIALIVFL